MAVWAIVVHCSVEVVGRIACIHEMNSDGVTARKGGIAVC